MKHYKNYTSPTIFMYKELKNTSKKKIRSLTEFFFCLLFVLLFSDGTYFCVFVEY
jgi:hypothetical protein